MTSSITATSINTVWMARCHTARRPAGAINSVLNQSCADFEFILVDARGVGKTLHIFQTSSASDPRLVIATKPNTELSDPLRVGIKMSRGKRISSFDTVDVCAPTRLAINWMRL